MIANTSNAVDLVEALQGEDESSRINSALALAKASDSAAIPVLVAALNHESQVLRFRHAAAALAALGERAVPALLQVLDGEVRGRAAAAYALYKIDESRSETVVAALTRVLVDGDAAARDDAATALIEIGAPGQNAVPALLRMLEDDDELAAGRGRAALALAAISEPRADIVPALVRALSARDDRVGVQAAYALSCLAGSLPAVVPDLIRVLQDRGVAVEVRARVANVLAMAGEPAAEIVRALQQALNDEDWWVRVYAARSLGEVGTAARVAVPTLAKLTRDEDDQVRRNAIWALAQLGAAAGEAVPDLIEALRRDDVAGVAAQALAKIGELALPALIKALRGGSLDRLAAYALVNTDRSEARAAVAASGVEPFTLSPTHFYLPAPGLTLDCQEKEAFERLFQLTLERGTGRIIDYTFPYPKHAFLTYLVEHKGCMIHGSNRCDIGVLKPVRWSTDVSAHGNVNGVYADPDGIRPIYFAVVDRQNYQVGLGNGFFDVTGDDGTTKRYYHFSIDAESLRKAPWTNGMIYILPRDSFEEWEEWTSTSPVRPLAKLAVSPVDFPFLKQIQGFDWRLKGPLSQDFPFLDQVRIFPIGCHQ